jgi:hypothetical protein
MWKKSAMSGAPVQIAAAARLEVGTLHQGRPQAELGEVEREVDDDQRGAHQAEVRGRQKPGEEDKDDRLQNRDRSVAHRSPDHPTDGAVSEAGGVSGHARTKADPVGLFAGTGDGGEV